MGTADIRIRVVGNHGCQREVGTGQQTQPKCSACQASGGECVDSIAKEFVERLRRQGSIVDATLLHWPDSSPMIVDDLRTLTRYGKF